MPYIPYNGWLRSTLSTPPLLFMVVFSSTPAQQSICGPNAHTLLNPFLNLKIKSSWSSTLFWIEVAAENEIDILYSSYTFHSLSLWFATRLVIHKLFAILENFKGFSCRSLNDSCWGVWLVFPFCSSAQSSGQNYPKKKTKFSFTSNVCRALLNTEYCGFPQCIFLGSFLCIF